MEELKSLEDLQRDHLTNAINTLRSEFYKLLTSEQLQLLPKDTELSWEEYGNLIYIPTRAKTAFEQNEFLLTDEIDRFLNDPVKRIAVVLGDPGSGKTTFAKRWLTECFQDYEKNKSTKTPSFLPLFIELQQVLNKNYVTPNKLLEEYLKRVGLSSPEIISIRSIPLLVLCDGYDEVSYEGNLYQDNDWQNWANAKFIITTRPEKFGLGRNISELRDILSTTFSPREGDNTGLVCYQLHDFNESDVRLFVQQWQVLANSGWDETTYLEKLKQIPGLIDLTSNPIILSLMLFTLPDLVKQYDAVATTSATLPSSSSPFVASSSAIVEQKHFERVHIYDFFVEKWFNHQANKVWRKLEELNAGLKQRLWKLTQRQGFKLADALYEYTTQLGYWCLRHGMDGKLRIEIPVHETLKKYLLPEKFKPKNLTVEEIDQLLTALRSGCLLRCDSENFKFFHKTLVEHFAQAHIVKGVVGKLLLDDKCEELNIKIAEPKLLEDLAKRAKENKMFRDYLYAVLRESKKTADVGIAAANAITILSKAKQPLNQESWQGIRIPGADLSYTNLHGVDFSDADLTQVNFTGAYLEEANLSGSCLRGCKWSIPSSINFESSIITIVYPKGESWLLVGEKKGKIHLVDLNSGMIDQTLKPYNLMYWKSDKIISLAIDGDASRVSQLMASVAKNGDIYLWSFSSKKVIDQGKLSHAGVQCIALSGDGQFLVSGSKNGSICIWNVATKQELNKFEEQADEITSLLLSSNAQRLVTKVGNKIIFVWDMASRRKLAKFEGEEGELISVAFSVNGRLVAAGNKYGVIYVWDIELKSKASRFEGDDGDITSIAFSVDGQRMAAGDKYGVIFIWDIRLKRKIVKFKSHMEYVTSLVFSNDGQRIISGSQDNSIRVWDFELNARDQIKPLENLRDTVYRSTDGVTILEQKISEPIRLLSCLEFSNDGQRMVAGGNWSKTISIWDVKLERRELVTWGRFNGVWVTCVAFSNDGQYIAAGDEDNTISLWDGVLGKKLIKMGKVQNGIGVTSVVFSNDSRLMVSGSWDKIIRVWDVSSGAESFQFIGHIKQVNSVAFSNDGRLVASGSWDKTIRIWDVSSHQELKKLEGHTSSVNSVSFSHNGKQVVSGSSDNTVCVWDIDLGRKLVKFEGHTKEVSKVLFINSSQQVVSVSNDYTVRIWDILSRTCVQTIHVNFVVTSVWVEEAQLKVGGYQNTSVQVLSYQKNARGQYYLQLYWDDLIEFVNSHPYAQMNISRTTGLTLKQQQLVVNQGATGMPAALVYFDATDVESKEDATYLQQLKNIKEDLKNYKESRVQVPSIFNVAHNVSYQLWGIYLYRVTKPTTSGYSDGASRSNRHVYGIAEGLDQRNRRLLIRFDLVEDRNQKDIGVVKIKIVEIDSHDLLAGRQGFITLCHNDHTPIVCFAAGTLRLAQVDNLFARIIDEMQRQFHVDETQRIRYRFQGGNDRIGESHNCLTWLRYLFKDFKELKIPRGTFDFFVANPVEILPSSSGFFSSDLPAGIEVLNTSDWVNTAAEAIAAPSQGFNR